MSFPIYNAGTTPLLEQQKAVWKLINNSDGTLTLSRVENTNATSSEAVGSVQDEAILKEANDITDGAILKVVVPYTAVPTKPDVPTTPTTPDVPTTWQLSHGGTPSKHKYVTTSKSNETTLPQTSEKESNYNLAAIILTLLSALLFAFTGKKHKND